MEKPASGQLTGSCARLWAEAAAARLVSQTYTSKWWGNLGKRWEIFKNLCLYIYQGLDFFQLKMRLIPRTLDSIPVSFTRTRGGGNH